MIIKIARTKIVNQLMKFENFGNLFENNPIKS
jgi:hypothetical protein